MNLRSLLMVTILGGVLLGLPALAGESPSGQNAVATSLRTFSAQGVIQKIPADQLMVVIKHDAISNYMAAMTMPFNVKDAHLLAALHPGDKVTFRLNITEDESWVDQIYKVGTAPLDQDHSQSLAGRREVTSDESFMDYALTNELGQKVTLNDFHGQALAITFFYTRCPLPDFCPRLSKNFQEAADKLRALSGGPTNWHFLSISFDTEFDTPAQLEAYGNLYEYHSNEWSFVTGSAADIKELARISGVEYTADGGGFQHNFRTLIVDATGRLQMAFPMGGNISDQIVAQMLKAAAATNLPNLSALIH